MVTPKYYHDDLLTNDSKTLQLQLINKDREDMFYNISKVNQLAIMLQVVAIEQGLLDVVTCSATLSPPYSSTQTPTHNIRMDMV